MPGTPSIKNERVYRALRRKGMPKSQAAAISNAQVQKASGVAPLAIPPGALFNQPGVGVRSTRRRRCLKEFDWGATVGQVISGNLVRGDGGRFSGSGGPSARQTMSPAQRKRRDEARARRQARAAERAAAHEAELATEETTRAEEDDYIASGATGRERQRRRAEIAAKRRQRAAARREARRREAETERAARAQEDAAEQAPRAEEEQAKPAKGGGGGKAQPTDEEKRAEQQKKRAENRAKTAPQVGLRAEEAEALATAAGGGKVDEAQIDGLAELGLITATGDNQFEATDAGRRALAALERGDVRAALAAIQDGKAKVARDAARTADSAARDEAKKKRDAERAKRDAERERARQQREGERDARSAEQARREQEREDNRRRREQQGRERTPVLAAQIIRNLAERRQRRRRKEAGVFTVFKDASGADRWASITTTAYRDKDGEWISSEAIRNVVVAGDDGAPRGPLRFWHVPHLDLGDCDYQAALDGGRLLLESGTFRSKAAAKIGAEAAQRGYQMSPGFVHTRSEPRGGVFNSIALFERSFVPPGRASNPYTRLLTKETRMLTDEKRKEFEALAGDDEGRALLQSLLASAETTTKALDAAGAVYKDAPAWAQDLDRRLKAFEAKAPMPAEEMMEAGATEADDGLAELETMEEPASDLLDDEGFADLIVQRLLAQLGPLLELEKKVGGYLGEMKSLLPQMAQQVAQKDDAQQQVIADLNARLKALEGDQPRRSLTAGVWGDLTGAGIQVTKEQAAALTAQQPNQQAPVGLSGVEADAYRLIYGNE